MERHSSQKTATGNMTKGVVPIEKNIIVIDKDNNMLNKTYKKRAKQLVKNNRAYYVDDQTICLTDKKEEVMSEVTYEAILEKIDLVIKENEQLTKNITEVQKENLSKDQLKTILRLYKEKEKTNRRMIKELRKIYDDQSGRNVRKSILKTARISVKNGEKIDYDKLLSDINETR